MYPKQATEGITPDSHPDVIARREINAGLHDDPALIEAMRQTHADGPIAGGAEVARRALDATVSVLADGHRLPHVLPSWPVPSSKPRGRGRPPKLRVAPLLEKIVALVRGEWWQRQGRSSHLASKARPAAVSERNAIGRRSTERLLRAREQLGSDASADDLADSAGMDTSTARKKLRKLRD